MKINLRAELAKTFQLFRANANTRIFLFGGYNHFEFIANEYKYLTGLNLFSEISGYVDNDQCKQNETYNGFPIISPLELNKDDFIIITGTPVHLAMYRQLCQLGFIHRYNFILSWDFEMICKRFIFSQIRKFQGTQNGERCFIIGNGPSITLNDLNVLGKNNVPAFASNNFFKLFNKTDFRPNYYVITDVLNLDEHNIIFNESKITCFMEMIYRNHNVNLDNVYFFEQSMWTNYGYYPYKPLFSDDIAFTYECGSVSYAMLQLAVNMGFMEIYFLGMDNNFPLLITHDGTLVQENNAIHHFYENTNPTQVCYTKDLFEAGCKYAKEYCWQRVIKIYKATRGGKLEIFERVDFDSLFKK
jgi:hypothetical protein